MAPPPHGIHIISSSFLAPLCILSLLFFTASATTFTVGNTKGWNLAVDYASWATGKTFKVGDVLYFPYDQAAHDVVQVPKASYDSCSTDNSISNDLGAGNTKITLVKPGNHYFICGVIGHCGGGMKLAIDVVAASTQAPKPSPVSSSPSPSPVPNARPSPTPTPTSNPALVPALASSATPTPAESTLTPSPSSSLPSGPASASLPPQAGQNAASDLLRGATVALGSLTLGYAALFL